MPNTGVEKAIFGFIVTNTRTIYSKINSIMATERLEMFSFMVGIIAAVMIMMLFLSRLNSIFPNNPDLCCRC